eukprot:g27949.t1
MLPGPQVAELRAWRLLAVGLDTNPLLTATLNAYGLVADVTEANLSFTLRSAHPRCNFRPHLGKFAKGGEYEDAGQSAGVQFDGRPNKQDMSNPTGWINWINYVAARCCGQLTCQRQTWRSSQEVWLYEKYQDLPDVAEAQVASPFEHGPGILLPVQSGATMDWAICLDVGEQLNGRRQQARLLANLGRLAGEGILISWGRRAPRDDSWWLRDLALLGFQRDKDLEGELRLFAGREFGSRCDLRWERIALQEHLRHSLCVLRRGTPRPRHPRCALEPVKATPYCELGITFGCLDAQHIWLRGHCAGLFRRFAPRSSNRSTAAVGECRLVTTSLHEYEECKLPEPVEPSSPGHLAVETSRGTESPAHRPSYDCVSLGVPLEDFWRLHGISLNALFDSADPLVRMAEPIWTQESWSCKAAVSALRPPLRHAASERASFGELLQECGCKCGESIATLGAFFIAAAGAFWLVGALAGWNDFEAWDKDGTQTVPGMAVQKPEEEHPAGAPLSSKDVEETKDMDRSTSDEEDATDDASKTKMLDHMKDVTVAVIGNVDSGKSTLVGVLTKGGLDDGRGLARAKVFNFSHEAANGRTSSIAQEIMGFNSGGDQVLIERMANTTANSRNTTWQQVMEKSERLVTFSDLCGHEKYLKTTIFGLVGQCPDYTMIIVNANAGFQRMSREHLGIALALRIPFFIVVTKIDIAPQNVYEENLMQLHKIVRSNAVKRQPLVVKEPEELEGAARGIYQKEVCPIFCISSVTGEGLPLLRNFLRCPAEFHIDSIYVVPGVGLVVGGVVRAGRIRVGQQLLLGPDKVSQFKPVLVKTIQYKRVTVDFAESGQHCSFALRSLVKRDRRVGKWGFSQGDAVAIAWASTPSNL